MKTPTLTLANPITCEPGLTGETGNMMFPCIVRVVDGKVVELIINTQTGLHVKDVGRAWRVQLLSP